MASGESKGWFEADADDVELVLAEQTVQPLHGVVQRARLRRADLEAAGVDEAHQQRLAA